MKDYFGRYIAYVLEKLEAEDTDFALLEKEILTKISFMQHERLIHFLVVFLVAIAMFISFGIFFATENIGFLAAAVLTLGLLIPYFPHYYFLENGVQRLYGLYDLAHGKAVGGNH
ncbi:MAG: hypothetical protein FWG90_06730 [Oscillospiraceae bacterium]|nr:hypothetical protein [Oscillospiraceae bacterium]